jgi:hypothetical protein
MHIVMAGLVPAIHALAAVRRHGCPASQTSLRSLRKLDCVAGHDGGAIRTDPIPNFVSTCSARDAARQKNESWRQSGKMWRLGSGFVQAWYGTLQIEGDVRS